MIQLTFQSALDPFHTMFRFLRLRTLLTEIGERSVDHVRIMDFYVTFPFRIADIRLQPSHRKFRRLAELYAHTRPYGEQPDDQALFERMAPMHWAALETLAANRFIDAGRLRESWVTPSDMHLRPALQSRIDEVNELEVDLLEFIRILGTDYQVAGTNGLKHRTGLMEHRYDVV